MLRIGSIGLILVLVLCTAGVGLQQVWADADANEAAVVQGNSQFAIDLYGQLAAQRSGNLFLSPYSISAALAMTCDGARGQTATQIEQAMHFTLGHGQLNAAFSALSTDLDNGGTVNGNQVYDLSLANSLWGQTGFAYNPDFIQTLKQDYGADVNQVDYSDQNAAAQTINQWVSNNTNDKIQNMFSPDDFNTDNTQTTMVLVNAIYFKGNWASAFDPTLTVSQPFHLDAQNTETVSMMHQQEALNYFANDDAQMAEFQYVGGNLSMVIILPRQVDGLAALEQSLTLEKLSRWLGHLTSYQVSAMMPKFQLTSRFDLTKELKAMGMTDAFHRTADFSGITGQGGFQITSVIHQAYVNVDESGTEAAAATGVIGGTYITALAPPLPQAVFRANHPFLFLIRDRVSGTILFMGRVTDPNS
jgi:serpin B